jgi:hypothetical protein
MARYGRSPAYRKIWQGAVDARFPAHQGENGRYLASADDVAEAFGLIEQPAAGA